jgi:hypothetical protein
MFLFHRCKDLCNMQEVARLFQLICHEIKLQIHADLLIVYINSVQ